MRFFFFFHEDEINYGMKPPVVEIEAPQEPVVVGSNITLRCQASSLHTPIMMWWVKMNGTAEPTFLKGDFTTQNERPDTYVLALTITNSSFKDAGDYKCFAKNGVGLSPTAKNISLIIATREGTDEASPCYARKYDGNGLISLINVQQLLLCFSIALTVLWWLIRFSGSYRLLLQLWVFRRRVSHCCLLMWCAIGRTNQQHGGTFSQDNQNHSDKPCPRHRRRPGSSCSDYVDDDVHLHQAAEAGGLGHEEADPDGRGQASAVPRQRAWGGGRR